MRLPRSTYFPQRTAPSPLTSISHILAFTAALFTQYAFAVKEDSFRRDDHNHPRLSGALEADVGHDLKRYEPEFTGADRSIIGRADVGNPALGNNVPGNLTLSQNDSQYWTFPSAALFGPKSPQTPGLPSYFKDQIISVPSDPPGEVGLYISLTTCRQPLAQTPKSKGAPEQLKLYISTSSTNPQPDENNNDYNVPINEGHGSVRLSVKNDVHFGVYAPATEGFDGVYNYQLTGSIDGFYASSYNDPNVYFVDSDTKSALLYTSNTTNTTNSLDPVFRQWMDRAPVFSLFVQNQDNSSILGLQNSVCGLLNLAQIQGPNVENNMTTAGDGLPRQQFHVKNLNQSSAYYTVLAMIGNSTNHGPGVVGGGGTVWYSANTRNFITNFTTKSCKSIDNHLPLTQSLTMFFQSTIAPSFSICPSALPLHMQFRPIVQPSIQQSFSANSTTITPKASIKTSKTPSNRFRATLHPLLSILSPEIAAIATPLTENGFAQSLYPDARISQT